MVYRINTIFNMASVRHVGFVVMILHLGTIFYVANIMLNFQVNWFSNFRYTWTFMIQHFDLKVPILDQILKFWGFLRVNLKKK